MFADSGVSRSRSLHALVSTAAALFVPDMSTKSLYTATLTGKSVSRSPSVGGRIDETATADSERESRTPLSSAFDVRLAKLAHETVDQAPSAHA